MTRTKQPGSARERLLAAATELFYDEGVHTVGIDRVIERAGVAKASLYSAFGSKDELVRAYLQGRADLRQQRILDWLAPIADPRERLLAIFDFLAMTAAEPTFRGCAFINASAEGPRGETKITRVSADYRAWKRRLFTDLAHACGISNSDTLAEQLMVLYDGAIVAASMDRDLGAVKAAREMASMVLDASLGASSPAP